MLMICMQMIGLRGENFIGDQTLRRPTTTLILLEKTKEETRLIGNKTTLQETILGKKLKHKRGRKIIANINGRVHWELCSKADITNSSGGTHFEKGSLVLSKKSCVE